MAYFPLDLPLREVRWRCRHRQRTCGKRGIWRHGTIEREETLSLRRSQAASFSTPSPSNPLRHRRCPFYPRFHRFSRPLKISRCQLRSLRPLPPFRPRPTLLHPSNSLCLCELYLPGWPRNPPISRWFIPNPVLPRRLNLRDPRIKVEETHKSTQDYAVYEGDCEDACMRVLIEDG